MGRVFRAVCCSTILLAAGSLLAQEMPLCEVTCEPDPESLTYELTVPVRKVSYNARGRQSVFSSPAAGGATQSSLAGDSVAGSESYNYAIPVLSLPGRNGLDLNLTLYYNSRIWTIDKTNGTATLNADRDFPSYGFRLGFGYLEYSPDSNEYILTESDNSKRHLGLVQTGLYDSSDSTYTRFYSEYGILRYKNGSTVFYEAIPEKANLFRPIQLQDSNGNYIEVQYRDDSWVQGLEIDQIKDTLGRIIAFAYDPTDHFLTGVSHDAPEGTRTYRFFWDTAYVLKYDFSLDVEDSPASDSTQNVLTELRYPNDTRFRFEYGDWGIVNKIEQRSSNNTLRGYVSYNYPSSATQLSDHPTYTTQTVVDGASAPAEWTYDVAKPNGVVTSMTVTDPFGTKTKTTLTSDGLVASVTITPSGTSNPLRTVANTWNGTAGNNPTLASVQTTLNDSGQASRTEFIYTSYGNISEVKEYDFGLVLKRRTVTEYLSGSAHTAARILDRPSRVEIYGPWGVIARTDFAYDQADLNSISGTAANHDGSNYSATDRTRGNVTEIIRYPNAPNTSEAISRSFSYDMLGNLIAAELDCCNERTWDYDSTTEWAYPVKMTSGSSTTQLVVQYAYDFDTGVTTAITDENEKVTSFEYDSMNRLVKVTRPDNVEITTTFDDTSAAPKVAQTTPIEQNKSAVSAATFNMAGKPTRNELQDLSLNVLARVDTEYDSLGRASAVSNPYKPGETALYTTAEYDSLGRPDKVIPPDGSSSANHTSYAYFGNATTVTDPAGKQRRTYVDALGRIVRVDEPGGTAGVGSVQIGGQGGGYVEECDEWGLCLWYYDSGTITVTVGSLVKQANWGAYSTAQQMASDLAWAFNNDPDSPVDATVSGTNPATVHFTARESGEYTNYTLSSSEQQDDPEHFWFPSFLTVVSGSSMTGGSEESTSPSLNEPFVTRYTYDALDNLKQVLQGAQERTYAYNALGRLTSATTPESGTVSFTYTSASQVGQRTDARGVVATHVYDTLNRLIEVSYNVGSTGVPATPTVTYTYGASASSNNRGRLTSVSDGSFSESYTYDLLGRVTQVSRDIDSVAYNVGYTYNLASEIATITYPSGRVLTQEYDPIGRLNKVSSSATTYLTVPSNGVNAAGQITAMNYGNGVEAEFSYNSRLQLDALKYSKGTTDLLDLAYGYGSANNGQIQGVTDNLDSTRSLSLVYDEWARLGQATAGSSQSPQWKLGFVYDRYGNRAQQNVLAGSGPAPQLTISKYTNRITDTGYDYDDAGNMTEDGLHSYEYDAENRMTAVDGTAATYAYFGASRIKKVAGSTTTRYIFSGSLVLAEYENGAAVSSPTREYIYAGGSLVATHQGQSLKYHHRDHLSARVITDEDGESIGEQGHFPFGEVWYQTGTIVKWKFTTYERDGESGLDYAIYRSHSSRLGRFMSPDRLPGIIVSPQSLNRYAYVGNDPVNFVDPLGLCRLYYWRMVNNGYWEETEDEPVYVPPAWEMVGLFCGMQDLVPIDLFFVDAVAADVGLEEIVRSATVLTRILLNLDPDCLKFLAAGGFDPIDILNQVLTLDLLGVFQLSDNIVAQTPGARPNEMITFNSQGAFFSPTVRGYPARVSDGKFVGGSLPAQVATVLHELGHVTGVLQNDVVPGRSAKKNRQVGRANDKAINKHCQRALRLVSR